MSTQVISDTEFEAEVVKADTPVLVDFYAEWCGPCKALAPTLDEVAQEMSGKVKIVKVNIEESPDAPTKYGVRAVPTLMVFKNGDVVAQAAGAKSKSDLVNWIESSL